MRATIGKAVFEPGGGVYRDAWAVEVNLPGTRAGAVYGETAAEAVARAEALAAEWDAAHAVVAAGRAAR
jgi:hypothetical protein